MLAHKNLYAELRLQPTAGASDIRTAYRRAALLAHPDKGGSVAAFHSIAFAFEVLSCPMSRALYDRARRQWETLRCQSTGRTNVKQHVSSTVTAQHAFTLRAKRKREPTTAASSAAPKRHQMSSHPEQDDDQGASRADDTCGEVAGGTDDPPPAPKHADRDIHSTLEQLRNALQDMAPVHRRPEIAQMPLHVRTELLKYMSCQDAPVIMLGAAQTRKKVQRQAVPREFKSRGTDVRTLKYIHKTTYQAQLRVQHLRMYTRAQPDLGMGISHQMALVRARRAIDEAGEEVWSRPQEFFNVFVAALTSAGTSPEELGLSVFIFMRADEWIDRRTTITSPVMSLQSAVAAHARLLAARQTSWPQLRSEWVLLMRQTQHARLQRLSQSQAEAVAEKARMGLLQRRLKQAMSAADHAIRLRCHRDQKVVKTQSQLQRRAAKDKAALQKQRVQKRHDLWAARRRLYRRLDLTMEDILQGPLENT